MKIGIDGRVLMDDQYSGVSEYTLNLIWNILKINQEKHGHEIKLFYNSAKNIRNRLPDFKDFSIEYIYTRYPNKSFNYLMQKGLKYPKLDKFLDVDLLLFPHINFFSVSGDRKTVLTIHDLSFLRYPNFFSSRKNFWHRMLNVPDMAKKANKIITISQNTKNDIVELLDEDERKVEVVYSGIDVNEFKEIHDSYKLKEIKEKYNLANKFILYLGTLEPRKNVEGLINAFDIFKNRYPKSAYKLVIVGGNGWKDKGIYKAWKEAANKNDIKFIGYIPRKDKVYVYNLASLFVFPSFYEGFGLPPLEAMASGTPVITSFTSSLPEVVGGSAIMIDPFRCDDIARAIEKVLFNKQLYHKMIESGKKKVEVFNWENTAKKYLKIMESI